MKKNTLLLAVILTVLCSCTAHKSPAAVDLAVNTDVDIRVTQYDLYDVTGSRIFFVECIYEAPGNMIRRNLYNGGYDYQGHMEHNISNTRFDTFDSLDVLVEWVDQTFAGDMITGQIKYRQGPVINSSVVNSFINGVYDTTYYYNGTGVSGSTNTKYIYTNGILDRVENRAAADNSLENYFVFDYSQAGVITANKYDSADMITLSKIVFHISPEPSNISFDTFLVMIMDM